MTVTSDGTPAALLYASSSQLNLAVPATVPGADAYLFHSYSVMQVMVNGVPAEARALPVVNNAPNLFTSASTSAASCPETIAGEAIALFANNADGSVNSCSNPAKPGTVISLFVDGVNVKGQVSELPVAVTIGHWSAEVVNVTEANPYVLRIDVTVPSTVATLGSLELGSLARVVVYFNFASGIVQGGPLTVAPSSLDPYTHQLLLGLWITK